jgi:hypothetical protein
MFLSDMKYRVMGAMTLGITTFSITTPSIKGLYMILSIFDTKHKWYLA